MRFLEFKNKVSKWPYIKSQDLTKFADNKQTIRNQLYRWQKQGLIKKLKKGLYILNETDRKINPSKPFFANHLYSPSYVSLEYALNFYGLIPERVFAVTSVTTKKTKTINNELGPFIYRKIKKNAYRGFKREQDESGLSYFMADAEKAVLDILYLSTSKFNHISKNTFSSFFRFQNTEILDLQKLAEYQKLYHSKKLDRIINKFINFVKETNYA